MPKKKKFVPKSNNKSKNSFERALALQRAGKIDAAEKIYSELLTNLPESLGNLGIIKRQKGQLEEAARLQRMALQISPKHKVTQSNLVNVLMDLKRYSEVKEVLLEAIEDHPDDVSFQRRLASLLARHSDVENLNGAVKIFQRLLVNKPDDLTVVSALGDCLTRLNRKDEAIDILQPHSAHTEIRYKLQVLRGESIDRAPEDYVQEHFDKFAPNYENKLVEGLGYRTPDLIIKTLLDDFEAPPHFDSALDLGCGTGLLGVKLRPYCGVITGIDLSSKMLALADEKKIYDHLETADIVAFLSETDEAYDLILSADVFVYVGDLAPIFALVERRLKPGGHFLFSTEHANDGDFTTMSSGRFSHSEPYIKRIADDAGLVVQAAQQEPVRMEYSKEVIGGLYMMRSQPGLSPVLRRSVTSE